MKKESAYIEGRCEDSWFFYGTPQICRNEFATEADKEEGGCIFFEAKWEAPIPDEYEAYQKEWN